jgi:hypothetical protein
MTCIYKIISPSGKIYIGQTRDYEGRILRHRYNARSVNYPLYKSMRKYGTDRHLFIIVEVLPDDISKRDLDNLEILYISALKSSNYQLLNCTPGGRGGSCDPEIGEKISKAKKGIPLSKAGRKAHNKIIMAMRKPINQYDKQGNFIQEWSCITSAAEILGLDKGNISGVCTGKKSFHTAGGFIFKFVNN